MFKMNRMILKAPAPALSDVSNLGGRKAKEKMPQIRVRMEIRIM